MKRTLCLLLSLVLLLGLVPASALAAAPDEIVLIDEEPGEIALVDEVPNASSKYSAVYIAGNGKPGSTWLSGISWNPGKNKMIELEENRWIMGYTKVAPGDYEFKFTLGSWDKGVWTYDGDAVDPGEYYFAVPGSKDSVSIRFTLRQTADVGIAFDYKLDQPRFAVAISGLSGKCGDNLSWKLSYDLADFVTTMTISGSGDMWDFNNQDPGWADAQKCIKSLVVKSGVTGIGDQAFRGATHLDELNLPASVTRIGASAFEDCVALSAVTLPGSVTKLGARAFAGCSKLREITFQGGAPSFGSKVFNEVTATAVYPAGNKSWTSAVMKNYGGKITWEPRIDAAPPVPALAGMSTKGLALKWSAVSNAEKYEVQRRKGSGWTTVGTAKTASLTDADVKMGETYTYRVRAFADGGWTVFSDTLEQQFYPFTDVSGKKTLEYVGWAFNNGIVTGTSDTTFKPDATCTRVQFVMMLWKMHGSPVVEGPNPFSDISGKKTTNAILWALKAGVINSSSKFDPDGNISRVQIVMILWKLAGSPTVKGTNPFTDVSGSKTTKAVLWAYENGITKGTSATTFAPDADCTRVQLVIFLYKYNDIYPVI